MGGLHLIGVAHYDPRGPRRLRKFIKSISPDVIALEYDEDAAEWTDRFYSLPLHERKELLRVPHANEKTLEFYAQHTNYEYVVVKESSIPFILADKKRQVAVKSIEKAREAGKMTVCFSLREIQQWIDQAYSRSRHCPDYIRELKARDKVMEAEVRKLYGAIMFPVGGTHIFGHYHNLFDRLADLRPRRRLLPDADRL